MAFFETVRAAPILFTILSVGPMSSAFAASEAEPSYEEASQWCLPEKEQIRELNDAFASGHPHPDSEHVAAQRAHTDCYNARLQVWKATYAVGTSPASAPAAPPARRVQPQPAPAPGPALSPARSDSNPYRVSRSDAEAVQIATREATAAIDEILAEPAKETARRVAQLEHDNKHEGEDIGLYDTVLTRKDALKVFENLPAGRG